MVRSWYAARMRSVPSRATATTVGVSGALVVCTILGDWTRYVSPERHSTSALAWIGSVGVFIGFGLGFRLVYARFRDI